MTTTTEPLWLVPAECGHITIEIFQNDDRPPRREPDTSGQRPWRRRVPPSRRYLRARR